MKNSGCLFLVLVFILSIVMLFSCAAGMMSDSEKADDNLENDLSGGEVSSRKLVKNASLDVETKDFDALHDMLENTVKTLEGYVESKQITGGSGSSMRRATIVARIPAEKLDTFIAAVKAAGNVTEESSSVKDVTFNYIDVESRLNALRTEEATLLSLIENAESLDSILTIHTRLTDVRATIEYYESQMRQLDDSVDYSTVKLYVYEVERITVTEKTSIWTRIGNNLSDGFKNVWLFLKELFVFVLSAIPYLLIIGVFAALVTLIVKLAGKRKIKNNNKGNGGVNGAGNGSTNGYGVYPPPEK